MKTPPSGFRRCLFIGFTMSFVCLTLATSAAAFENLDFEGTLLDFTDAETGEFDPNKNSSDFRREAEDISVVVPGWSFRAEFQNGEVTTDYYSLHGTLLGAHIGGTPDITLTTLGRGRAGRPTLPFTRRVFRSLAPLESYAPYSFTIRESRHSLALDGGDQRFGGYGSTILPVAYQTGYIPYNARSIQVDVACTEYYCDGKPVADTFSVRIDGRVIPMVRVDEYEPRAGTVTYAGDLKGLSGTTAELAIRPEPLPSFGWAGDVVFDNIIFSRDQAPDVPVRVPEPTGLTLLLASTVLAASKRNRRC